MSEQEISKIDEQEEKEFRYRFKKFENKYYKKYFEQNTNIDEQMYEQNKKIYLKLVHLMAKAEIIIKCMEKAKKRKNITPEYIEKANFYKKLYAEILFYTDKALETFFKWEDYAKKLKQ